MKRKLKLGKDHYIYKNSKTNLIKVIIVEVKITNWFRK